MIKQLFAALFMSATLLTTTACGSSTMKAPDVKFNPHPTKRYDLTITIKDAPGPFTSMETLAQYDVANPFCVPTQPGSGATNAPDKTVPIKMTKVGDNRYTGTFYTDLMLDEDYAGKGVCQWQLTAVSMYLQHKKLMMPPSISLASIVANKSETWFFSGLSYADADNERVDVGLADGSKLVASDHPFSVTFVAKENFQ
jgi:hypothetical protein